MIRVAVSILNYKSSQSTIGCVQSLLTAYRENSDCSDLDIFVADNGSGNDDQLLLQQSLAELPGVHLRLDSENRGFSAGHNGNLRAIFLRSNPDYIWILNNDCLVYETTLVSLISCAQQRPDVGVWGATLLESDGEIIQCAGGCSYNSWVSSYRQYGRGATLAKIDQLESVDYDYIAGASLFLPVATLQKGLQPVPNQSAEKGVVSQQWLNENFFLYFEELDLAQRLKPGYAMAWCKSALIKHVGGASTGAVENQRTKLAEYHSTLSALKYTQLHYPQRLWFMAPARYLSKCLQLMAKGNLRLLGSLTRAYRDFLGG
jgi:GT2 family glycosyltransferase